MNQPKVKAARIQEILSGQEYDWLFDPQKLHDKIREAGIKEPASVVKSELSDAEAGQESKLASSIPEGAPVAAVNTEEKPIPKKLTMMEKIALM